MSSRQEKSLESVLAAWNELTTRGETPDIEAACELHPELASELRAHFEAMQLLQDAAPDDSIEPLTPDTETRAVRAHLRPLPHDRYVDFRPAGEGGMGLVYWALDTDLNRQVAFKVVRPDVGSLDRVDTEGDPLALTPPGKGTPASEAFETLRARFLQEAWVTGGLEHPGIVPVYELGETAKGVPYYTMRFVRGERTLAAAIKEAKDEPIEERLALLDPFLRICDTIEYAHAQGVIHRDLKPENIALGSYGEVVVLDWGLSKLQNQQDQAGEAWHEQIELFRKAENLETVAGALGTPGYMSPEAAMGRVDSVDSLSDVYSLGAMLFEILTGELPHHFTNYMELIQALRGTEPPRIADRAADVPQELAVICERALSPARADRHAGVADLASALRRWQVLSAKRRDAERHLADAQAVFEGAQGLEGGTLLTQMDRVLRSLERTLDAEPEHQGALSLRSEARTRREEGIAAEASAQRARTIRRAVAIAASVVVVLATTFAITYRSERDRATEAEGNALQSAAESERARRAYMVQALASLAQEQGAAIPGRGLLLAAEALLALPEDEEIPLSIWSAVQTAIDRAPQGIPVGRPADVKFDDAGQRCFVLDEPRRELRVVDLAPTETRRDMRVALPGRVRSFSVTGSGSFVLLHLEDGTVMRLVVPEDEGAATPTLEDGGRRHVAVAVGGSLWAGLRENGEIVATQGDVLTALATVPGATLLAVAPDGRHIAAQAKDTVRIWRLQEAAPRWVELQLEQMASLVRRDAKAPPALSFAGDVLQADAETGLRLIDLAASDSIWIQRRLLAYNQHARVALHEGGRWCTARDSGRRGLLCIDIREQVTHELESTEPAQDLLAGGGGWLVAKLRKGAVETWSLLAEDVAASRRQFDVGPDAEFVFVRAASTRLIAIARPPKRAPTAHWLDMRTGAATIQDFADPVPELAGDEWTEERVRLGRYLGLSPAGDYAVFGAGPEKPPGSMMVVDLRGSLPEAACVSVPAHDFEAPASVRWLRDGIWLLTDAWDSREDSRLWHLPTVLPEREITAGSVTGEPTTGGAFTPDGRRIVYTSAAGETCIGRFEGTSVRRVIARLPGEIAEPAFTADGNHIHGRNESALHGWRVHPEIEKIEPLDFGDAPTFAHAADGSLRRVAVLRGEKAGVEVFERRPGSGWTLRWTLGKGAFDHVAINAAGTLVVAADDDGVIHGWRLPTEGDSPVQTLQPVAPSAEGSPFVESFVLTPDGRIVAALYDPEGVYAFAVERDRFVRVPVEPGFIGEELALDASGRWLGIGHYDRVIAFDTRDAHVGETWRPAPQRFLVGGSYRVLHPAGDRVLTNKGDDLEIAGESRDVRRPLRRRTTTGSAAYATGVVRGRWLCIGLDGVHTTRIYDLAADRPAASEREVPYGLRTYSDGAAYPHRGVFLGSLASLLRWDPSPSTGPEFEPMRLWPDATGSSGGAFLHGSRWFMSDPVYSNDGPLVIWDLRAAASDRVAWIPEIHHSSRTGEQISADGSTYVILRDRGPRPGIDMYRAQGPGEKMAGPTTVAMRTQKPDAQPIVPGLLSVWSPRPRFELGRNGRWLVAVIDAEVVAFDLRSGEPALRHRLAGLEDEERVDVLARLPRGSRDYFLCVSVDRQDGTLRTRLIGAEGSDSAPRILAQHDAQPTWHHTPRVVDAFRRPGGVMGHDGAGMRLLWSVTEAGTLETAIMPRERVVDQECAAWSASRRWCVFGDSRGGLQVSDGRAGALDEPGVRMNAHDGAVISVWVDEAERWLVSRGDRGLLKFWPLQRMDLLRVMASHLSRDFRPEEWGVYRGETAWRSTRAALRAALDTSGSHDTHASRNTAYAGGRRSK